MKDALRRSISELHQVNYDGSVLKGLYPLVRCHTKNVHDKSDRKPENKELMTLNLQSMALCSVCTRRKTISNKSQGKWESLKDGFDQPLLWRNGVRDCHTLKDNTWQIWSLWRYARSHIQLWTQVKRLHLRYERWPTYDAFRAWRSQQANLKLVTSPARIQ